MTTEINYDLYDTITGIKKDSIVDEAIKNIVEKLVPDEIEYKGHYYVLAESRKTEDGYYKTSHNLVDIVSKLKYNLGFKIGKASAIEEYRKEMHDMIQGNEEFTDWQKHEILECNELVAEQLKEKKE